MKWKLLILLIVLTGCSAEKQIWRTHKLIEKHPSVLNKYRITDTLRTDSIHVTYRDTTVEIFIPGDTVIKHVNVPCPDIESDTLEAVSGPVRAEAWLSEGRLHLTIYRAPMVSKWRLDSALKDTEHYQKLYIQEILKLPPEKAQVKWFYKAALWGWFGAVFIAALLFAILAILKRFPKSPK